MCIKRMLLKKRFGFMLRSTSGRNNKGRLTVFTRGGGLKKYYLPIDFYRNLHNIAGKILSISRNSHSSAFCSLVLYKNGFLSHIITPNCVDVGQTVISSTVPYTYKIGDCLLLKFIQIGTVIHNIELYPGNGFKLARSAGVFAKILRQDRHHTLIKLSSGEQRLVLNSCKATIGSISNSSHFLEKYKKAGIPRILGFRPKVRGIARNPVDHPNGGRTKIGTAYRDKWGNLSKGGRLKKNYNPLIIKKRTSIRAI